MLIKNSLVCLLLFLIGCNDIKKEEPTIELNNNAQVASDLQIVNSLGVTLNTASKKLVEDWPEYKIIDETIENFYNISSEEALLKANDLSIYTQQLRDSIRVDILDVPAMKIRLNVLYNTSLRLADMETIKSIKPDEVKTEVTNIINAFSAVNSKINNVIAQKNIEKELTDFEDK
jgi:hypothetical protein